MYCWIKVFLNNLPFHWKKYYVLQSLISLKISLKLCYTILFFNILCTGQIPSIFVWEDFQVGWFFLFEKFDIILKISNSWQYIPLLCTKEKQRHYETLKTLPPCHSYTTLPFSCSNIFSKFDFLKFRRRVWQYVAMLRSVGGKSGKI